MKFSGQMDLDEWSKSCDRLKIPRCSLQGDMVVARAENDLGPLHALLPPQIVILRFSGLRFFSDN